ncbi:Uncharacterized protein ESCO_000912 [Escovopsis weberi]|uniref:CCAAT-binding factor domain-containing protein n=1 Tax=Escovopsis weberi TaxID=150374 RepID=A0A0M8N3S7_ESCWE|nr:Uncharacterized protein ESCO_000912 [Escovopsis weberi]
MPSASSDAPKRKRVPAEDKAVKRRRSSSDEGEDAGARILLMEKKISESRKHYNDITILLSKAGDFEKDQEESMLATVALCRVFVRFLAQETLILKKGMSEKDLIVVNWLKDQFSQFKTLLLGILGVEDIATTGLALCMRILKAEGEYARSKETYSFPVGWLECIISTLIMTDCDEARKSFLEEFVEQYDDIRYHTFKLVNVILDKVDKEKIPKGLFHRVFGLLSALDGVPESAEELEDFYVPKPQKKNHNVLSVHQHKRVAQEAWLAVMTIVEDRDQRKQILGIISTTIAPWFTRPELLSDFLTGCYHAGGSMSLLALSGVFYLIQERNLDYPSFYPKIYSLLDRDILHSKHRSRFFRLLDTFLGSTHLPAALIASFVKRLSRLTLNAPPSAVAFAIPWIYNLLKRHPLCTFMLHRETRDADSRKHMQEHGAEDVFKPEEADPMLTGAIDSCLWEVVQLQSHYHPNVATIAKIVSEQFTKQSYNMEDFLDHSYASLLDAEMAKEVRKAPVVEFHIPKRIFLPQDPPATESNSLLVRLWDFSDSVKA